MDTSGLLLLALNPDAQRGLSAQFEARLVGKRYVAVVRGRLPDAAGVINTPIRADWARRPVQVVDRAGGRDAVTRFRVLAELADGTSRVELEPLTGRSHQLRLHLASVGCPIVGDPLYGPHGPGWPGWQGGAVLAPEPQMAGERAAHQPGRMLLHASGLAFTDPLSGEPVRLHCEPEF
jgi:tRNA pseudouridine32 synthase/23S rRNA pseudouridine746 synthase